MKFKDFRVWIFIFGLVSLVAVYLYQQSKTNREQLEFQSVKAIHLAKQSFLENYYNYNVQLEEFLARNFFRIIDPDPDSPAAQMVAIIDRDKKFNISQIRAIPASEKMQAQMLQPTIDVIQKDTLGYFTILNQFFDFSQRLINVQQLDYNRLVNQFQEAIAGEIVEERAGDSKSGIFQIDHIIPIDELMKYNFQTYFFDELYVLNDSGEVLWPGESRGIQLLTPEEEATEPPGEGLSLTNKGQGKVKLLINTVPYEGFVSPFMLGDNSFFLLGVKDSSEFRQVAYRIDFSVLNVFLLGLVLIFISIPLISIFTMSEGDVLTKGRMFGVGLSLIVLTLVVGFALAFVQNQRATLSYDNIIQEIEDTFSISINSYDDKLSQFHKEIDLGPLDSVLSPFPSEINEFIHFSYDGKISSLAFPTSEKKLKKIDFKTNPFISIASRDYVKEIKDSLKNSFISAHYSKSNGELEGVISQRMTENEGRAITFKMSGGNSTLGSQHRFLVFKPNGQVLLKSAKVNTPVTNLQNVIGENKWAELQKLVENNDSSSLDHVWKIPIYVNGFEYLATLKRMPLDNFSTSIWLIFLVDEHLQDTLYVLTTFEALAVLIPYTLVLAILGVLITLANPLNTYLSVKKFSFSWYSPSLAKRGQFLLANYLLAFLIGLYLIVYWYIPLNIFTVFLWAIVFSSQGGLINFILIHPQGVGKYGSREFNFMAPALFMWLLVVSGLLYLSFVSLDLVYFFVNLSIVLALLAILGVCFYVMLKNQLPQLNSDFSRKGENMSPLKSIHFRLTKFWNFITQIRVEKRIFSLNFLLWLCIIGLIPGYVIHRQVFFQEIYLWDDDSSGYQEKQVQINGDGFFLDLILNHEKLRRLNFSRIANNAEERVYKFISPNVEKLIASFSLDKNWLTEQNDKAPKSILDVVIGKFGDKPLFFIGVLLLLLLFFNLLLRLTKRIYLTDYLFSFYIKKLPSACLIRKYNFIISIDNQKAKEWIDFHFRFSDKNRMVINCSAGTPELPHLQEGIDAIVIENIHNLMETEDLLTLMYQFRETYFFSGRSIFFTSGISLQDMLESIKSSKHRLLLAELMQPFLFYIVPLNFNNKEASIPFIGESSEGLPAEEVNRLNSMIKSRLFNDTKTLQLNQEIGYGNNSEALACLLTDEIGTDDWEGEMAAERYEKTILSIQRFNKAYFITVWQKLNLREKKMVYYFASEGFINYTNRETMTALLQKGVLILNFQQDYITLFSKSFRNYVLLNTSPDELDAFKRDERRRGNTKLIQAAAISFVFICIAILSFYDPNILDTTSAYISAAIGLAGTVYSFFYKGFRNIWKNEE
ncbi:hypothetical protein [Lunatibacter salilacus]|uniref:hypothetical protein n=1 Tax=Lunatibacter salilacus TaxID=2483804 RepID=UPI00131A887D|nr:hypothetical protein [Lunatibacter salilacus]